MPSVQLGLRHVPAVQAPVAQSLPAAQRLPDGHGLHVPPQSISVSLPFFTESAHPAVWQTPAVHTELRQSLANRHAAPPLHAPHAPPPQSMSVSLPFLTKSVQLAARRAAQTRRHAGARSFADLARRTMDRSAAAVRVRLATVDDGVAARRGLTRAARAVLARTVSGSCAVGEIGARPTADPPQSTSVSVPFRKARRCSPVPDRRSSWSKNPCSRRRGTQDFAIAQPGQAAPPQSTSVSEPF
jgi:hypothetical protein